MLQNRVQQNLFPYVIKSIGYDQIDILQDIMTLYCPQGFECDPTYSVGNFYKSIIPEPIYKSDINPQCPGVIKADVIDLPLHSNSISSVLFDPPFVHSRSKKLEKMKQRFSAFFWNTKQLLTFYEIATREISRILKSKGIFVFKCQDCIDDKNYFIHIDVYNYACKYGFKALDLFILLAKSRIINFKQQQHARKYHSYFWVFQKA
jgi:hypothetical protein